MSDIQTDTSWEYPAPDAVIDTDLKDDWLGDPAVVGTAPAEIDTFSVSSEPDLSPSVEPDPAPAAEPTVAKDRRSKNALEEMVRAITDEFVSGHIQLEDGKRLTPHKIASLIATKYGVKAPSAGAVTANLKRWADIGFITYTDSPFAFKGYTDAGTTQGLAALKATGRAAKAAARKANATPVQVVTVNPDGEPVSDPSEPAA